VINIEDIVRQEVERQNSLQSLMSHLDDESKRMVLARSADQYKRCKQLIELEEY
jgi:hypothetical protein